MPYIDEEGRKRDGTPDPVTTCAHCGGSKDVRNPTGMCDHLYWPDNLTDEAKRANGFAPVPTIAWMKTDVSKDEMIDFLAGAKSGEKPF